MEIRERSRDHENHEESEEEVFELEDQLDNLREANKKRYWWKKHFPSLLSMSESAGMDNKNNNNVRNPSTVSSFLDRLVIRPDSWWYTVWMHFILIWAVYSSFFTPLEFGFFRGLPENLFILDIAGQIAFLIDIVVCFFVAYRDFHSHRMVYDRNLIALRYLKSRFLVDLLGCLPWDAIFKASGRKEPVRYLLWIRLSRAQRVTEFFEKLEKDIRLNYLFTRITKLFVVELYSTHAAACVFYYLATTLPESKEGYTWIGSLKLGDYSYSHFREIDLWKRYVTSLYFAVVTMATVGYGEIHAVNVREMIFIMLYVSFDMILAAYLLGNIAALIVKGSRTERFRDNMTELIKYMNRNNLDKHISAEIKRHLRLQYDRKYTEASVLKDIPFFLRTKVSQNLYEPYIKEVLLFKGCSLEFIKQIATRVHEEFFLPGEVIIEEGQMVEQLYILCHGELVEDGKSEGSEKEEFHKRLQAYSSIGEVSFLCNTPQNYTVLVRELCRVLRLDKHSFTDILKTYYLDGQIILNNFNVEKDFNIRKKLLESDIAIHINNQELELVARVNCAAHSGDLHRVKLLTGAGADPNMTDYDGRSPLHIAASRGYEDITIFLIERGVDVNIADKFGNTPLLEAIKNNHDEVTSSLTKAGASLTMDDAGGFLCSIVARKNTDLLKRVLANEINPNAKNYDQRTPLHIASADGLYEMAELLLQAGASVLSKDRWGNTPLEEAHIGGNKKLVKLLEEARSSQLMQLSGSS